MNNPILIHPQRNAMTLPDGSVICFTQRWEATLLAMLLTRARANRDLSAEMLRTELHRRGQTQALNRTQHSRLIKSLAEGLEHIPARPVVLEYGPRKATVGPWRLGFRTACAFAVDQNDPIGDLGTISSESLLSADDGTTGTTWSWPRMLAVRDLDGLRNLLSSCLVSDAFAILGNFQSALETLQPAWALPLSCDARTVLLLREALYHKRLGEFGEARVRTLQVIKTDPTNLQDPALRDFASFLLDRIDYDESPSTAQIRLWELSKAPSPVLGVDLRTAPEWHNLRALLARRRLLAMAAEPGRMASDETVCNLHWHALLHLETAIYWALSMKDWEKLQSFVANVAFHLQSVMPLGLSDVHQVLAWYVLMMNYAEKLDAGRDSAWEFIFLGKFWLDHVDELCQLRQASCTTEDPFSVVHDLHPAYENFYLRAIERLQHCADWRQVAIAWINYLRFSRLNLSKEKQAATAKSLSALLQNVPSLRDELEAEGYGSFLPPRA